MYVDVSWMDVSMSSYVNIIILFGFHGWMDGQNGIVLSSPTNGVCNVG